MLPMEWDFQWGCIKGFDIEPWGVYAEEYLKAQNNIKIIYIPYSNELDLEEIPDEIKNNITIKLVKNYQEIYEELFLN